MWIFEGILYVILLLVFIRYDRKKRLWIKTVSQEEKFEHYLSELSATYGKQKNIEEAVAEVEESHTVTLPTEHSYVRIYGAMCAVIREDGDMLSDGYSVFQRNLQYLKEEIRENLLLCSWQRLEFMDLSYGCFCRMRNKKTGTGWKSGCYSFHGWHIYWMSMSVGIIQNV